MPPLCPHCASTVSSLQFCHSWPCLRLGLVKSVIFSKNSDFQTFSKSGPKSGPKTVIFWHLLTKKPYPNPGAFANPVILLKSGKKQQKQWFLVNFAKKAYPIPGAFVNFAVFATTAPPLATTAGRSEHFVQNPYPMPGAFTKIVTFSRKCHEKWHFSSYQICRWHFGENH